ncbi:Calx-beta domain-containing protein, partial [Thiocapsa sp. C3-3m]
MKPSRQIGPIVISALSLLGLLAGTSGAAVLPHLDDANYEPTRALMAPLDRHLFPRVSLSETKGLPTTAEAISKYDTLLLGVSQMTANVAAAQQINPDLLVFWKFNPVGYSGFLATDPCNDVRGVAFGRTGNATEECSFYAGHWAYFAGTTLSQGIGDTTLTATVGDGSRVTAGRYVVIYDAPAGSFKNAEHALVKSVNGNIVTFASRGFKSVAHVRAAGAIVAEHPVPGGANGTVTPEHWMYNMSTQAPADANGRQLIEIQADWLADNLRSVNNVRVDGIIFDTDSWSQAWQTRLDVDNDLVADGGWSSSDDTNHWGDGMEHFYWLVRDRFPAEIVVGGDRATRGYDTLSGTQMEGFPVSGVYYSADPEYNKLDEVFANYTLHLRKGPEHLAAFTETLSKTPTKLYPRDASPVPVGNAPFRFGFAATLLDDGYYAQEPLLISRDPWWDEFAVDVTPGSASYGHAIASNPQDETLTRTHRGWLGLPLGARERIFDAQHFELARSLIAAGNLDNSAALTGWRSSKVTMSFDSSEAMAGAGSLRVSGHQSYASEPYYAQVKTPAVALQAGIEYTLVFSVKADRLRSITISAGGTTQGFDVPDHWVRRVMTFTASATGSSTINFNVGRENIPLRLDEVYLFEGNANVFMREFENGLVVVNATARPRTVDLGASYLRIKGTGQDHINDGSEVTTITIAPHDAAILVNPPTAYPELSVEDVAVSEADGVARFAVSLSAPSALPVTLSYAMLDGSARSGADYTAVAGSLSFAPGETARTVEVAVLDDLLHEPTESFSLVLSAASGATLVRDTA